MATERQIAANQRNSARSTGPSSVEGKARSRVNATTHGMAGSSSQGEASLSPEFANRRAKWAASFQPVDEPAEWALDRAVAATFRIERCERAVDRVATEIKNRATLSWDEDRGVEAAEVFGRLGREPILASRQLQMTLAGVRLLIDAWFLLVETLESGVDWSESEASQALDLLGITPKFRTGRMIIDAPEGANSITFRLELAIEELERLEELRDTSMIPLDEMEQAHAMEGDLAILSKRAKLVLRYERDAWKRYRDAMKQIKEQTTNSEALSTPPHVRVASVAAVVKSPRIHSRPTTISAKSLEADGQAMTDEFDAMGFENDDAWFDELEQRLDNQSPNPRRIATERTQSAGLVQARCVPLGAED